MFNKEKISIRRVSLKDTEVLFEWANDENTREASFSPKKILLQDHKIWLQEKINSKDTEQYIFEDENRAPFAQIRFDYYKDQKHWEVDVSVSPGLRNKGLGKFVILEGCKKLAERKGEVTVLARIKIENKASLEAFKKAGFILLEQGEHKGFIVSNMIWKKP